MSSWKMAMKTVGAISFALIFAAAGWGGDIKGKVSVQGLKSTENIVVYIDAISGKKFDPPAEHAVVDQSKIAFVPRVIVVLEGTTVDFVNSDSVGHNVFWPSISGNKKLAHNLGTWPQGQKKSFQFTKAGVASLLCNVHPEMSGYVVIVPTPYYAVTDNTGSFEIKNVPAGTYAVKTWSEDGKVATQSVTVTNEAASIDLTVKK